MGLDTDPRPAKRTIIKDIYNLFLNMKLLIR